MPTYQTFKRPPLTHFTTVAKISYRPGKAYVQMQERVGALVDGNLLEALLRQAMAETVLVAYRRRFLAGLAQATTMQLDAEAHRAAPEVSARIRSQIAAAYQEEAQASPAEIPEIQRRIGDLQSRLHKALEPRDRSLLGRLPHGNYRSLALQVLYLSASANQIQRAPGDGLRLGVGPLAALAQLETPSATQALTGNATSSEYNTMWRQLEFGTGYYAKPEANSGSRFRLPSGGWWYGESEQVALHLKGTRGIHALRDPQTQLPYDVDVQRLTGRFHELLRQVLFGRYAPGSR